jgi:hypothetical protein
LYDYFLGGSHHFAVDRDMARQLLQHAPDAGEVMRANRSFLRRAVRYLLGAGITQFLDIGSGIPTVGNVHEIAQQADPYARVVYVDRDPVAVAHSRAMLDGHPYAGVVRSDLLDVDTILGSPEVDKLIDFSRPVGLLIVSVLHFLLDSDDPFTAVAHLRAAMPPGSYLVISHATPVRPETEEFQAAYQRSVNQGTTRTGPEIARFFGDFALVEPGLVYLPQWRPDDPSDVDDHPERFVSLCGVGRRP